MGGAASKGHNMVPARFALPEQVRVKGASAQSVGKRERAARLAALRSGKAYNALASNSAYARAGRADIARAEKAQAAAELWAARRQRLSNAASRVASATRKGAAAAAGAVATGVGALGAGVGAAGSFLGRGARAAYNKAASQTRKAYQGLRALSLKRRAKNFFFGKVKLTNANRALAQARGLNPNSTEFRKLLANRGAAGRPGSVAANKSARALEREGGLGRKVASLTRKAKEGLAAAAAAAARGVVAAKNAVTKKASNWYAYSRNMVKYGRRRSDLERLESAKARAKAKQNRNFSAIQRARNANAAAKVAAAARDKKLKEIQAGITAAGSKMGAAAAAAASGAGAAAAGLAAAALAGIGAVTQKARNLGGAAGTAVSGALGKLGRAASTLKAEVKNSAHKTGNNAKTSLFGKRPPNNKGGNSTLKVAPLKAAQSQLKTAGTAVGNAQGAAPGKVGSLLGRAASAVAGAVVAAGSAVGRGASAVVGSARHAGSTIKNAIRYRIAALGNASAAYSMSLATRKKASANRRAAVAAPKPLSAVREGKENNNNSNSAAKRRAALNTAAMARINGRPARLNQLSPANQAAVIALSQMPRRVPPST